MALRISWTNNSSGHTGTYVYRAETIDPQNLPAPVATVDPVAQGATAEWVSNEELAAGDYDYAVQDFDGDDVGALSQIFKHTIQTGVSAIYFRINITKTREEGTYEASMANLQFRSEIGVDEINTGTYLASSTYGGSFSPDKAFDGDNSTTWLPLADETLPEWIGINLGESKIVREVSMVPVDSSGAESRGPEDFEIQKSDDGVNWVTVKTVLGEPAWSKSEARTYAL